MSSGIAPVSGIRKAKENDRVKLKQLEKLGGISENIAKEIWDREKNLPKMLARG